MRFLSFLFFIILSFGFSSCTDQETPFDPGPVTEVAAAGFGVDLTDKMLLYNGAAFNPTQQQLLIEEEAIQFSADQEILDLGIAYAVTWQNKAYQFFRTELPILVIQTRNGEEVSDIYSNAEFNLIEDGALMTTGNMGIRLRGNTSRWFPKTSYRLELWEDEAGNTNRSVSMLGMREDDDWLLDGMWNEPLAIRDKSAMELWLSFGRVHYQPEEPDVQLGADRRYCELFIDGSYKGLYYLGERLDRKQLKLEVYTSPLSGGELYKAKGWGDAVGGFSLPEVDNSSTEWGNYEVKYPTDPGTFDWTKLRQFKDFFINGSITDINDESAEKVDLNNLADYFIFTNLIYAFDNQGNNVYIARRDQMSPYFFVSWDYDATLGIGITGEEIPSADGVLLHLVTDRLLWTDAFRNALKTRWESLKDNQLQADRVKTFYLNNYTLLSRNKIYERESVISRFERDLPGDAQLEAIMLKLDERLLFLEEYITAL